MPHNYAPEMTNSGLSPTQKVLVKDEYKNTRELSIAEERPLTIYTVSYTHLTLPTTPYV